ncbi:MAG: hypothetical protein PWQ57_967 [Desulfovibrionales bacterium]|nr:hypothetical protein [Desulfovibrionales bacterium]
MPRSMPALAAALLLMLSVSSAWAFQGQYTVDALQDMPHDHRFNSTSDFAFTVGLGGYPRANMEKSTGGYGLMRAKATAWWKQVYLTYERDQYFWVNSEDANIGDQSSEPFSQLNYVALGWNFLNATANPFGWNSTYAPFVFKAGAALSSSFESTVSDSFGGALYAQVKGQFVDGWVLPLAWVRYNGIHPTDGFMLGRFDFGLNIEIPGTRFVKYLSDKGALDADAPSSLDMNLMFYSRTRFYRLSNTSSVIPGGYLETRELTISFLFDYKPVSDISIQLMPEFLFERKLNTYDTHGNREKIYRVQETVGGTVSLNYYF